MHVILGATGHVGSMVATALLQADRKVGIITRDPTKAAAWREKGATVFVVDIADTSALHDVFCQARRVFLLNPPASPATDTDREERRTVHSILTALKGIEFDKIVLQSTYGAQPGDHCGDLGTLYEFEQGAQKLGQPLSIIRAAYYMSNWLPLARTAATSGHFLSLLPAELKVPMVAPEDVGRFAADLMNAPTVGINIYDIEGPEHYSASDVVKVFTHLFRRPVAVQDIPRKSWLGHYRQTGFSEEAARSYARMTGLFIDGRYEQPAHPYKGQTSLAAYFQNSFANH